MTRPTPPSRPKYLVETSALRPALGSPSHKHNQHFSDAVRDGELFTSVYIRMEFVRHWICYFIRAALYFRQCDNVANALYHLEQDFGRGPKDALSMIQQHLAGCGSLSSATSAEEIASLAMRFLERFDNVFPKSIENSCRCQIGGNSPEVDYDSILHDLYAFYEAFLAPVQDCQINKFLRSRRRAESLTKNEALAGLSAVKNLTDLQRRSKWITCTECRRIGDAVIALDQPASHCLVHIDQAFDKLCPALERDHKPIASAVAADPIKLKPSSQEEPGKA
jgi:hypothetical protein